MNHLCGRTGLVRRFAILMAGVSIAIVAAMTAAPAAQLVPHRAAYQVQLVEPRGEVTTAAGLLTVENSRTCEGWSVVATLRMRFELADGSTPETEVTFSSVETHTQYRFSSVEMANGGTVGQIRGRATLTERDGDGVVYFLAPERREEPLPRGIVFPTKHMLQTLGAAERGEERIGHILFEATRWRESPFEVTTFILSGARPGDEGQGAGLGPLTERPWWPMRMAFHSSRDRQQAPTYEVTTNLQDNGVVRAYVVEDANVALAFALTAIEALPMPRC